MSFFIVPELEVGLRRNEGRGVPACDDRPVPGSLGPCALRIPSGDATLGSGEGRGPAASGRSAAPPHQANAPPER